MFSYYIIVSPIFLFGFFGKHAEEVLFGLGWVDMGGKGICGMVYLLCIYWIRTNCAYGAEEVFGERSIVVRPGIGYVDELWM